MEAATQHTSSTVRGLPDVDIGGVEPTTKPIDYGILNVAYFALLAGLVAAHQRRDPEERISGVELLPLGAATFSLSKAVAREKIGSWVREPFVDETACGQRLRGRRLRRAMAELVTCSRCIGTWSGLGIVGLRLAHPPAGRAVTSVLATAALNDFLQAGFRLLCRAVNQTEHQPTATTGGN
jgi:hypothetical protein